MNCYSGTVSATLVARMNRKSCVMKMGRNTHWDQGMPLSMKKPEMAMKPGDSM